MVGCATWSVIDLRAADHAVSGDLRVRVFLREHHELFGECEAHLRVDKGAGASRGCEERLAVVTGTSGASLIADVAMSGQATATTGVMEKRTFNVQRAAGCCASVAEACPLFSNNEDMLIDGQANNNSAEAWHPASTMKGEGRGAKNERPGAKRAAAVRLSLIALRPSFSKRRTLRCRKLDLVSSKVAAVTLREAGLEPATLSGPEPKSGASANSATLAGTADILPVPGSQYPVSSSQWSVRCGPGHTLREWGCHVVPRAEVSFVVILMAK